MEDPEDVNLKEKQAELILGRWRGSPFMPRTVAAAGFDVRFATDSNGRFPALDFLENLPGELGDRRVKSTDIERIAATIEQIRARGVGQSAGIPKNWFKLFDKGDDQKEGMAEFRVKSSNGVRLLCFAHGRELLITNGFIKPGQPETPNDEKRRARNVRGAHFARIVAQNPLTKKLPAKKKNGKH